MKRIISSLAVLALAGLPVFAMPKASFAAKCLDAFYVCYNDASKYSGGDKEIAEAECSLNYVGCLANSLKFW